DGLSQDAADAAREHLAPQRQDLEPLLKLDDDLVFLADRDQVEVADRDPLATQDFQALELHPVLPTKHAMEPPSGRADARRLLVDQEACAGGSYRPAKKKRGAPPRGEERLRVQFQGRISL